MEDKDIEFDWTSLYAIPHISFIISQVTPLRCCTGSPLREAQQQARAQFQGQSKKGITLLLCGGIFDGYIIPSYQKKKELESTVKRQYDVITLMNDALALKSTEDASTKSAAAAFVLDEKDTALGYTRLKIVQALQADIPVQCHYPLDGKIYFSSTAIQAHMKKELKLPVPQNEGISVGLPLQTWPIKALKWTTRERKSNWPDTELIKAVTEEPCLLVPGSHHQSHNRDLEWSYSFALPEKVLFDNMNDIQMQCMVAFRILRDHSLSFPSILSDYHVKTIFMWACERIPSEEWTYNTMGSYFVYLIDFLIECTVQENLPHYFMPEWNLFEEISEDFLDHLLMMLGEIRSMPMQTFYDFTMQNRLSYFPDTDRLCEIIKITKEDKTHDDSISPLKMHVFNIIEMDKVHDDYASILKKHARVVYILCEGLIWDGMLDEALHVADLHGLSDFYTVMPRFSHPPSILSEVVLTISPDKAIEVYEYLLSKYPTDQRMCEHLGNLGCMYHAKYSTAEDEKTKEEYKEKAESVFQKAISQKDPHCATLMDYGHFLYHTHDYTKAMAILDEIIRRHGKSKEGNYEENAYGFTELSTVDGNLLQEIQALGGDIAVQAYSYAYYIKVQILSKTAETTEAEKSLKLFWGACEELEENFQDPFFKAMGWNLYGYAARDAGKFQDAIQGFSKALSCDRRLPVVGTNIATCKALMESLGITDTGVQNSEDDMAEECKDLGAFVLPPEPKVAMVVSLPNEIATVRSLHAMYRSSTDEADRADHKETISTLCRNLLSQPGLHDFIQTDFAHFLLHVARPDEALSVLDEVLQRNAFEGPGGLSCTCYRKKDRAILDGRIKQDLLELEQAQLILPSVAYAFYLAIQALLQLNRFSDAKEILKKFKDACLAAERKEMDPDPIEMFRKLYGYASQDLQQKEAHGSMKGSLGNPKEEVKRTLDSASERAMAQRINAEEEVALQENTNPTALTPGSQSSQEVVQRKVQELLNAVSKPTVPQVCDLDLD